MSSYSLTAASMALIAIMGSQAVAQDAPADAQDLPQALTTLNLQDIQIEDARRGGRKIEGDLPDGGEIRAFVDADGNIRMIDADDTAMPQALIDELLPQAVRDNDILSQFAVVEKLGTFDGRVMVGGSDGDGEDLRAAFDEDGRLIRFGRGDDDMKGPRGMKGHERGHDKGDHRRGPDGERHGHKGDHGKGPRGDMPRIDRDALQEKLGEAGYTDLDNARHTGPRMVLDGTNAAGEAVTIEVDPAGEVVREIAR